MNGFRIMLLANIKRRCTDGFALGYNIIFPIIMIYLLGILTAGSFKGLPVNSYSYYGVVSISFCSFMSIVTAAFAGKDDAYNNTAERVLIAPISIKSIVLSKIIAETIVFSACNIIVILFSYIVFDSYTSSSLILVFILYIIITFMIAAIGTFIGLGMKDFMKIKNLLTVPVGIFALLGGCFYRFWSTNKILQFVMNISPLRWINEGVFNYLYDNNFEYLIIDLLLFFIIGIIFLVLAIKKFKKEEYCNGKLPSYEK